MEFSSLIVKKFNIRDINLTYFVGFNQIKLKSDKILHKEDNAKESTLVDQFFKAINESQTQYHNTSIQFMKDTYILNQDHIFTACYHVQRAFSKKLNISSKKEIELLLYMSTNRQIKKSIKTYGIDSSDLSKGKLTYCIISQSNNLNSINDDIVETLKANEESLTINTISNEKFNLIKEFYEISEHQINCILESYGIDSKIDLNLNFKFSALYDLICEKMVLLSIENT